MNRAHTCGHGTIRVSASAMLLFALLVPPSLSSGRALAAEGPAFDCSKASHEIEVLICQDDELAARDRKLADVYEQALAVLKGVADATDATAELKAYQRGWVGGRNDCWKADDKRQCTLDSYDRRIAGLQARYFLVEAQDPVFFACDDSAEIVATFVPTEPPTARLERGDSMEVAWLEPSGSGSKYVADFGISFRTKGDEAQVEWPQGNAFSCTVRQ